MRARTLLLCSIVLNVALASALVTWLVSAPKDTPRVVRPINAAAVASNSVLRVIKTNVLVRPRTFTWQEVESADYAVYVQNLRELGMPEKTIRDIIIADVDQIYSARRRNLAETQDLEWWRSTPSIESQTNAMARARAIESEREALLTRLLGPDWRSDGSRNANETIALAGPVLGSLPEDVKTNVRDIAQRSRARTQELISQAEAAGQPVNPAELARLREETRQQLAAVLTPAALEEFLLRYSENANLLRRELTGFNTTPEEFRAIFRAVDSIDRTLALRGSGNDAESQRIRQALEQQRVAAIRNALGGERFAAYQTLQDPVYQQAVLTAQQAGGSEETALALYEISRATSDEFVRIRNDPNLTEAQKQQQLREAEAEQQRARALVLGDEAALETAPPSPVQEPQLRPHQLIPGDTLGILSLRYGVSVNALREANPGVDINRARPGTVINVPPPGTAPAPPLPPGLPGR